MRRIATAIAAVLLLSIGGSAFAQEGESSATPGEAPGAVVAQDKAPNVPDASKAREAPKPPLPPKSADAVGLAKGGQLIGYGITVGAGLAVHVGPKLNEVMPTFMPYVAIFPGAWFVHGDATKTYCATRFTSGSAPASAVAASEVARARTRKQLGRSDDARVTDEEVFEQTQWDVNLPAKCGLFTWLGGYIGKPAAMTVNATLGGIETRRAFASYGSFGLISAPISFLSAFFGVTLWSVERKDKPNEQVATFTFGLGTNLDLLAAVVK